MNVVLLKFGNFILLSLEFEIGLNVKTKVLLICS